MADTLDEGIITEEFSTGNSTKVSSSNTTEPTQEFSFGTVPVAESLSETEEGNPVSSAEESEVASPSTPITLPATTAASGDMVSLDNLKAVSAMFENDCQTMQQIIDGSGLDKSTVMACVKWLTDNGLLSVSKSKKFYCTIDNVSAMQNQFKMCQKCFQK